MRITVKTPLGYDGYEAVSAVQKAIRRGDEATAMFFALELAAASRFAWVVSRIRVIAHEDVGPGAQLAVLFAERALDTATAWYKAKNDAWKMALGNAIAALAQCSGRSRFGAEFVGAIEGRRLAASEQAIPLPTVPDEAIDMHTLRGKGLGRGLDHFLSEGARVNAPHDGQTEYHDEARTYWLRTYKQPAQDGLNSHGGGEA